jgi:hypothetical protein
LPESPDEELLDDVSDLLDSAFFAGSGLVPPFDDSFEADELLESLDDPFEAFAPVL